MPEDKKTVLITGCTTGSIGHSLALEFDRRGCKVIATTRNPETMPDLVDHPTIETLRMDVCDQTSVASARDEVAKMTGGKLDILFNNAGGGTFIATILDTPMENAKSMFDTNFFSVVRVVQAFTPLLMHSPDARIINMSSLSSFLPLPTMSMYASAKAALNVFGDTLRVELAPLGIQVTTIMAGTVKNSRDPSHVSIIMEPDSPYHTVKDAFANVVAKAENGRMPGQTFAQTVVSQTLKRRPAVRIWAGGNSFVVWLLGIFMPTRLVDFVCARIYGLHRLAGVRDSRKTQ